jgi:hypothetical protein
MPVFFTVVPPVMVFGFHYRDGGAGVFAAGRQKEGQRNDDYGKESSHAVVAAKNSTF